MDLGESEIWWRGKLRLRHLIQPARLANICTLQWKRPGIHFVHAVYVISFFITVMHDYTISVSVSFCSPLLRLPPHHPRYHPHQTHKLHPHR